MLDRIFPDRRLYNHSSQRVIARALFSLELILVFVFCSSCTFRGTTAIAVDRHDPESVLRAYFEAWGRGDWSAEASFMTEKYAGMAPEPVELDPHPGDKCIECIPDRTRLPGLIRDQGKG